MIVRATRTVARANPGSVAAIGDVSRRGGGGSIEHKSHQSGRDVDIFYFGVTAAGNPMIPRSAMIHYDRTGRGTRWSPANGTRSPVGPVPDVRFDVRRNWQLVRALLRDGDAEVQWIFVQRDLASRLIQQGVAEGDDPALLARAVQIVRQPSDAEPHDDHMHVRIYCDPDDRALGCSDHGPVRWWKKRWKFMEPPFERGRAIDTTPMILDLLRTRIAFSVGPVRLAS